MAVISGKSGDLTLGGTSVVAFKQWQIDRSAAVSGTVNSGTSGWTAKTVGGKDWKGSFRMDHDSGADLVIDVGDTAAAVFLLATGKTRSGNIIITGIKEVVDYEKGDPDMVEVTFEGNGALTEAWA